MIEIDFDGTAMANPTNFILYNVKLERSIPTDRQTMRSCGGAVLDAGDTSAHRTMSTPWHQRGHTSAPRVGDTVNKP